MGCLNSSTGAGSMSQSDGPEDNIANSCTAFRELPAASLCPVVNRTIQTTRNPTIVSNVLAKATLCGQSQSARKTRPNLFQNGSDLLGSHQHRKRKFTGQARCCPRFAVEGRRKQT